MVAMLPGDYVLVDHGLLHAVGRVEVGAAEIIGPATDPKMVTLDVCILGNHLPQHYRRETECMVAEDLASHGLCERCRGWGLRSTPVDATTTELLNGQPWNLCPECRGSGRRGVTVTIEHMPDGATVGYLEKAADVLDGVTCEKCREGY